MANFNPATALIGGALIGVASVLLLLLVGRIAGISGILAGCLGGNWHDRSWRAAFMIGLIAAPLLAGAAGFPVSAPSLSTNWGLIAAAGLLVGFGTRLGGGCTSGHGICGIARLSPRSIAATIIFMTAAIVVVAIMRHGMGG
jgi:uncharacterized membrane protein YedE/YeeE